MSPSCRSRDEGQDSGKPAFGVLSSSNNKSLQVIGISAEALVIHNSPVKKNTRMMPIGRSVSERRDLGFFVSLMQ